MKNYFLILKPIHAIFALPFGIMGFIMANYLYNYEFKIYNFILSIICILIGRNIGIIFNRYLDKEIDAKNNRTKNRILPSKLISDSKILIFMNINILLFCICSFFINKICFYLSPISLIIILLYSYSKRYTYLCHLHLGISLAIAPIGGFIAACNNIALAPILLSIVVILWISGFDIIYSIQDVNFDKEEGLYSYASIKGSENAILLSFSLYILSIIIEISIGIVYKLVFYYWIGVILYSIILYIEYYILKYKYFNNINKFNLIAIMHGLSSISYFIFFVLSYLI